MQTGQELNAKIAEANTVWFGMGMSREQVLWVTALVDHESAGTWDPAIVGDSGCSIGIAQWNKCSGRIAPATFDEQVRQIGEEMMTKFQFFPIKTAVGKHNAPAWDYNAAYIAKVEAATKNFR